MGSGNKRGGLWVKMMEEGENTVMAAVGMLGEVAPRRRKTPGLGTMLGSWSRAVTLP